MKDKSYECIRRTLFDANEREPITLKNRQRNQIDFEQIFAVQRKGGLYCILRPLAPIEGLGVHAALVFSVDTKGIFRAVKEKSLSDAIFAEYYGALQRAQKRSKNER